VNAGRIVPRPGISKNIIGGALVGAILGLTLMDCGQVSEEQRLIDRFKHLAGLAEDKDTAGIMAALSSDYSDFEGRDKAATEEMIRGTFESYRGIVLSVLSVRLTDLQAEEATMDAEVAFSSGPAQALRRLIRLGGECYRINVRWVKENGAWMTAYAEWRAVDVGDLFPESREKLKTILPTK